MQRSAAASAPLWRSRLPHQRADVCFTQKRPSAFDPLRTLRPDRQSGGTNPQPEPIPSKSMKRSILLAQQHDAHEPHGGTEWRTLAKSGRRGC